MKCIYEGCPMDAVNGNFCQPCKERIDSRKPVKRDPHISNYWKGNDLHLIDCVYDMTKESNLHKPRIYSHLRKKVIKKPDVLNLQQFIGKE